MVTLTTDFGLADHYVAVMKAAVLRRCPAATLIDVTHQIHRHDVLCGSIMLERAIDGFEPGTVHLAVVDPGVGSARRLLVAKVDQQWVVCPDNGLITWAWRRLGPGQAYELTWRPERFSDVFHGRDIMAPVAGRLAAGEPVESLARPIDDPILLPIEPAKPPLDQGEIIHIDHFGNATTNVQWEDLKACGKSRSSVSNVEIGSLRRTYEDVAPGQPLALIGSSGLLEIAVRDGSAAAALGLRVGQIVKLS
jgi:S-adenosylmethionine hydrolase